jgi:multiple sugar transport system substrate-binding protein
MRRRMIAGLLVPAIAFGLAACAGSTPEQDAGAGGAGIVWAARAGDNEIAGKIAEAWNREHPDTPVRIEELPSNADQQRQQLTLELSAEGTLFDVVGLDVIWAGEFADNGWIEPLPELGREAEAVHLPGPLESGSYQGSQWALPLFTGAGFLYYRSDLLDVPPPRTWQELKEVGLRLSQETGIPAYAGQGASYEGMVVNYLEYLWSAGGDLFNDDQSAVVFGTTDAAMRALEFMRDAQADGFYHPGFTTMTEAEARPAFESGQAIFLRHWVGPYRTMAGEGSPVAETLGAAPLPTFDGTGTISAVGGYNLAVSAFSEQKELATEFVRFATLDEDVQRLVAETGLPPAMESIYAEFPDDPAFQLLAKVLPYARARPPVPEWNAISATMQTELFAAYTGQKEPQAAIDMIRKQLQEVVDGR